MVDDATRWVTNWWLAANSALIPASTSANCGASVLMMRIFAAMARGGAVVTSLQDTSQSELFIGSFVKGDLPFFGMLDEVRITPAVLGPKSFLLAGTQPIPELGSAREPLK